MEWVTSGPRAGTPTTPPSTSGTDTHKHMHHDRQPTSSLPVSGLGLPSKAWTHLPPAVALPGLCWPQRRATRSQRTCPAECLVSGWPSRPSCCAWWPAACCQQTPPLCVASWAPAETKANEPAEKEPQSDSDPSPRLSLNPNSRLNPTAAVNCALTLD